MTSPTPEQLAELARWDTPSLSNALDSLRLRPFETGYSDGSVSRITGSTTPAPRVMVGVAVTAKMVAREPGDNGVPVAQLHAKIVEMANTIGPVVVVLEDLDVPAGAGAFLGEVNGSLLDALGIAGIVTNGRVRDVNELRRFNYPVYASGLCVARAHMRLVEVGTPVCVAGLAVETGDILHGDEHGVLHVPMDALPAIFRKAELIREDEQRIVEWSRSPDFSIDALLALRRVRH